MSKLVIKGQSYEGIVSFMSNDSPDVLEISVVKKYKKDKKNYEFYDDFYKNNYLQNTRIYQAQKLIKKLSTYFFTSNSILEVGCGNGVFIDELLKSHKGDILGIDPCLKVETAHKKKFDLLEFDQDKKFDCIILLDVFEHFQNNKSVLNKITSLLSKNGYLILKVPNKDSLFYRISKIMSFFSDYFLARLYQIDFEPQHFYYYNKKSLRSLCERSGLEYMSHFYITEVPLRGLYERLWGISPLVKIIAIPLAILYNIFAFGFLKDSLIICFEKK